MKTFGFGLSVLLVSLIWAPEAAAHALTCVNESNYVYFIDDPVKGKKCQNSYNKDDCVIISNSLNCQWDKGSGYKQGSAPKTTPAPTPAPKPAPAPAAPKPTFNFTFNLGSKNNQEDEEEAKKEESQKSKPSKEKEPEVFNEATEAYAANRNNALSDTKPQPAPNKPKEESPNSKQIAEPDKDAEEEAKAAAKKAAELAEAKKEAKLAAEKVEEMKATMEEIKVANQNNAILYRSPDANIGSVDPRFNAFSAGLSGGSEDSGANGGLAGGLLGKAGLFGKGGKNGKDKSGRGLASKGNGEIDVAQKGDASGASTKGEESSAASENPWVRYMDQTSKAGLIDRLRKNPSLRDSLRDRIAELQAQGDQSGIVALMEEALATAETEAQGPNLDNLKPMGIMEAFSMDASETEAQIRSLLADLDTESDPQFLPQTSLFERVSVAHRRSLVRGTVKTNR